MSGETVLVIDDGKENRDFIVEYILTPNGFAPLVARDGEEGMELARRHHPDLILLDLQMPRMNGMEVLNALNAEQLDIPVILMTFHGSEEIAIEVYRKGVRDYVKKPYTVEEMYEAIERSMTEVRLRREKDQLTERLIEKNTELNQRLRELNVLYGMGKRVTALMDIDQLLVHVAEAAAQLTACEESSVYLIQDDRLYCKAITRQAEQKTYSLDEPREEALAMQAIQTAQIFVPSEQELILARRSNPSAPSAALAVPLLIAGHPLGALVVKNTSSGARLFTRNDGALLSALSDYAAIAYENASHHARAAAQAQPAENALARAVSPRMLEHIRANPQSIDSAGYRGEVSLWVARLHGHLAFAQKAPPEQVIGLVNSYLNIAMQVVLAADGTLIWLGNDSLLALFNAPLPQSDHSTRALNAALQLQGEIKARIAQQGRGLMFSLGVHVGEAVMGYLGDPLRGGYGVVGEGANTALALPALAGQIVLSSAAAQQVHPQAQLKRLEEHQCFEFVAWK